MVQEYERAVIFRLGRLLPIGAKGPGRKLDDDDNDNGDDDDDDDDNDDDEDEDDDDDDDDGDDGDDVGGGGGGGGDDGCGGGDDDVDDVFNVCIVIFAGLFFIVPCTDSYTKVDLRTVSFDVPPQEVQNYKLLLLLALILFIKFIKLLTINYAYINV